MWFISLPYYSFLRESASDCLRNFLFPWCQYFLHVDMRLGGDIHVENRWMTLEYFSYVGISSSFSADRKRSIKIFLYQTRQLSRIQWTVFQISGKIVITKMSHLALLHISAQLKTNQFVEKIIIKQNFVLKPAEDFKIPGDSYKKLLS